MFGQKGRGSLQCSPFLLSPTPGFLPPWSPTRPDFLKECAPLPVKPIPFLPRSSTTRGQMEILTSHQILENGNACGNSAPPLRLHPCASFACPPGSNNMLTLWHPVVFQVAHLCFQQIFPMVWWLLCASYLFYQSRTTASRWIPPSLANAHLMSTHSARPCVQL